MKYLSLAGAALAAAAALPASAQPVGAGHALTRADVQARVQARFASADSNRDGFVTREEAQARRGEARERLQGHRGERRAALFDRLDANGDGMLSRDEFEAQRTRTADSTGEGPRRGRLARPGGRGAEGGAAGRGFAALDADGDGRLSLREAQSAALRRFDRVDSNHDGTVTPDERRAARQAFREAPRG
jgi:hypothetical protein